MSKLHLQLATSVEPEKLTYPLWAQIKYDGNRIAVFVKGDEPAQFITRNGKHVVSTDLASIFNDKNYRKLALDHVLDGELIFKDGKSLERTSISGMVNSAIHGGMLDMTELVFVVFDYLTLDEYNSQHSIRPYKDRYESATCRVEKLNSPYVQIAINHELESAAQVNAMYEDVLKLGYEGLILKHPNHKYMFKRHKSWGKLKAIKSVDLTCSAVKPGEAGSKYENDIGAIKVYGMCEGVNVSTWVGSGLTDADRRLPDSAYLGKTIEVIYNTVIPAFNMQGHTLFLPRFKCIRIDK